MYEEKITNYYKANCILGNKFNNFSKDTVEDKIN